MNAGDTLEEIRQAGRRNKESKIQKYAVGDFYKVHTSAASFDGWRLRARLVNQAGYSRGKYYFSSSKK